MSTDRDYRVATPCHASFDTIQEFAETVAKRLGYKPGGKLEPIVRDLGGKIVFQDLENLSNTDGGSIVIDSQSMFTIYISRYTSSKRDRFTIAHELGHYFLHFPMDKKLSPMKASRYGNDLVEREANWFAAGFLMPSTAFKKILAEYDNDIDLVAAYFSVSKPAAKVRAATINL